MNKLLLGVIFILPLQLHAANGDSVYSWGAWAQGIKPAAGPAVRLTPAPAEQPQVGFRPNENAAFTRSILPAATPVITPPSPATPAPAIVEMPVDQATGDPRNGR